MLGAVLGAALGAHSPPRPLWDLLSGRGGGRRASAAQHLFTVAAVAAERLEGGVAPACSSVRSRSILRAACTLDLRHEIVARDVLPRVLPYDDDAEAPPLAADAVGRGSRGALRRCPRSARWRGAARRRRRRASRRPRGASCAEGGAGRPGRACAASSPGAREASGGRDPVAEARHRAREPDADRMPGEAPPVGGDSGTTRRACGQLVGMSSKRALPATSCPPLRVGCRPRLTRRGSASMSSKCAGYELGASTPAGPGRPTTHRAPTGTAAVLRRRRSTAPLWTLLFLAELRTAGKLFEARWRCRRWWARSRWALRSERTSSTSDDAAGAPCWTARLGLMLHGHMLALLDADRSSYAARIGARGVERRRLRLLGPLLIAFLLARPARPRLEGASRSAARWRRRRWGSRSTCSRRARCSTRRRGS